MSVIAYFRISKVRAKEILAEVERAVAGWRKTGRALGMTTVEIDQFVDAFEYSERLKAQAIR